VRRVWIDRADVGSAAERPPARYRLALAGRLDYDLVFTSADGRAIHPDPTVSLKDAHRSPTKATSRTETRPEWPTESARRPPPESPTRGANSAESDLGGTSAPECGQTFHQQRPLVIIL